MNREDGIHVSEQRKRKVMEVSGAFSAPDATLQQAVTLHMEAVNGNAAAALEANRLFEQLRQSFPGDPVVTAYFGSSLVLVSRDTTKVMEKMRLSREGMRLLDEAVASSPNDAVIRLLRGKNAYQLPEQYFQRTRTMIEDYTFLLEQYLLGGALPASVSYDELVQELGEGFARIGRNQEASELWSRLEQLSGDPVRSSLLRQKQSDLAGKPPVESIATDNPFSSLIDASRMVGSALVEWSGEGKKGKKNKKVEKLNRKNEKKSHKSNNSTKRNASNKKHRRSKEHSMVRIRR